MTDTVPAEYPPAQTPTVYADGIINLSTTLSVAKFYLARFDPSVTGDGTNKLQVFAQVVMPLQAIAQSYVFLEKTLSRMAKNNAILAEEIARAREVLKDE